MCTFSYLIIRLVYYIRPPYLLYAIQYIFRISYIHVIFFKCYSIYLSSYFNHKLLFNICIVSYFNHILFNIFIISYFNHILFNICIFSYFHHNLFNISTYVSSHISITYNSIYLSSDISITKYAT